MELGYRCNENPCPADPDCLTCARFVTEEYGPLDEDSNEKRVDKYYYMGVCEVGKGQVPAARFRVHYIDRKVAPCRQDERQRKTISTSVGTTGEWTSTLSEYEEEEEEEEWEEEEEEWESEEEEVEWESEEEEEWEEEEEEKEEEETEGSSEGSTMSSPSAGSEQSVLNESDASSVESRAPSVESEAPSLGSFGELEEGDETAAELDRILEEEVEEHGRSPSETSDYLVSEKEVQEMPEVASKSTSVVNTSTTSQSISTTDSTSPQPSAASVEPVQTEIVNISKENPLATIEETEDEGKRDSSDSVQPGPPKKPSKSRKKSVHKLSTSEDDLADQISRSRSVSEYDDSTASEPTKKKRHKKKQRDSDTTEEKKEQRVSNVSTQSDPEKRHMSVATDKRPSEQSVHERASVVTIVPHGTGKDEEDGAKDTKPRDSKKDLHPRESENRPSKSQVSVPVKRLSAMSTHARKSKAGSRKSEAKAKPRNSESRKKRKKRKSEHALSKAGTSQEEPDRTSTAQEDPPSPTTETTAPSEETSRQSRVSRRSSVSGPSSVSRPSSASRRSSVHGRKSESDAHGRHSTTGPSDQEHHAHHRKHKKKHHERKSHSSESKDKKHKHSCHYHGLGVCRNMFEPPWEGLLTECLSEDTKCHCSGVVAMLMRPEVLAVIVSIVIFIITKTYEFLSRVV